MPSNETQISLLQRYNTDTMQEHYIICMQMRSG